MSSAGFRGGIKGTLAFLVLQGPWLLSPAQSAPDSCPGAPCPSILLPSGPISHFAGELSSGRDLTLSEGNPSAGGGAVVWAVAALLVGSLGLCVVHLGALRMESRAWPAQVLPPREGLQRVC